MLNKKAILTGYSKIHELKLITVGLASPEQIQQWAEKVLPNGKVLGEVTNANTLHYKTFKPTKGGLFCERIFGPLKDFECACTIRQKPSKEESEKILDHLQMKRKFCPKCDVEYTWSIIRRYQLGYIRLISPVSHLWYLKANPSYLSILLDIKRKKLESIIYCIETTTLENLSKSSQTFSLDSSPSFLYFSWKEMLEEKTWGAMNNIELMRPKKQKKIINQQKIVPKKLFNWQAILVKNLIYSDSMQKLYQNSNFSTSIMSKIYLKIQKQLVPILWIQIWRLLWKKIYLNSLLKNSRIVQIVWLKYIKNKKNIVPTRLGYSYDQKKFLNKTTLSNQFDWQSYYEISKLIQKITLSNYSVQQKPLNPFLMNFTFDSYLQTYVYYDRTLLKDRIFVETTQYKQDSPFFLNIANKHYQNQSTVKTKNKKWISLSLNYILINLVTFLQINNKINKYSKLWLLISNLQKKNKLTKNILIQFVPNLKNFVKTMIFHLCQIQFKKRLTAISSIYNINLKSNSVKAIKSTPQKNHFIEQHLMSTYRLTNFWLDNSMLQNLKKICSRFSKKKWTNTLKTQKILNYYYDKNLLLKSQFELSTILKNSNALKFGKVKQQNTNFLNLFENQKNMSKNQMFLARKLMQNFVSLQSKLYFQKQLRNKNQLKNIKLKKPTTFLDSKISKYNKNLGFLNSNLKIVNNSYCISHLYTWDLERNWKYFLYYNSAPSSFDDSKIPVYKNQTMNNFSDLSSNTSLTGASLVQKLLSEFEVSELKKMSKQHRILLPKIRKKIRRLKAHGGKISKNNFSEIEKLLRKRDHIMRRLKVIRKVFRKSTNPSAMILSKLPVLPPDLRPILKMQDQIAASDLNTLYQRIIFRNDRLKKFLKDTAISQSFEAKYAQRLLQEAVDNLIQNGKGNVKPETNKRGQPLKSLSEILKGKQGRFRQYLLGKRVDYSGRSVIIVGPKLKLYECGLPKEMALELFLPFLIKRILHYKFATTIIGAKTLIKNKELIIWDLLREVMQNHPVLLNRAPTLHRLGIQAFQPKLVEGRAILIHPLVCPGFNADFDGDQMAVHVPLTVEARIEAWKLMFSGNNLISAATGEPILLPSQDMVLGCYYLTTEKLKFKQLQKRKLKKFINIANITNLQNKKQSVSLQSINKNNTNALLTAFYDMQAKNFLSTEFLPADFCFSNLEQVIKAYQLNKIDSHTSIWLKWNGFVETKPFRVEPIELQIDAFGYIEEIKSDKYCRFDPQSIRLHQFIHTTPGKVLFNVLIQNHLKQ